MKKEYISPIVETFECKANAMLMGSVLDYTEATQNITFTEEEFGGDFSSRENEFVFEEDEAF